ncbi:membrane-associated protein, putative, partial [Bodo saltans]
MRIQTSLVYLMLVKRKGQKMIPSMFLRFAPALLIAMLSQVSIAATTPAPASTTDPATNVTYITGTCKKTTPAFNISKYFNQEAMLVKNPSTVADPTNSKWDLAKDGAFAGYNVYFCAVTPTQYSGYPPAGFWQLMEQKGFTVRHSCNMASELTYPAFHVFILVDRSGTYPTTPTPTISVADAQAIAAFYVRGGGIYGLSDNCPHLANVNRMFQSFPSVVAKMQMRYNNDINNPYPLYNGNPVGDNQFGHHDAFTGVASMNSGHSLSIPYYNNAFGIGVFAPMGTVAINLVPIACASEPTAAFVYSHASILYLDPPVQLVEVPDTCNWGRIVLDTAWTRYGKEPMREGSHRFAANVVAWLVNIERVFERSTSSGGAYALLNCSRNASTSGDNDDDKTQVLGCSNGDAVTLKAPTMLCGVSFAGGAGGDAPKCLALVVTATAGTTCIVDLQTATIGTYWIIVDGKNTSLQFSVTAASLTPRGTVAAVTGTCVKTSDTAVR